MDHEVILQELASILKERGRLWIPARGFSMGPRWQMAEALDIESMEASDLQIYDVAVFRRDAIWIAHRVIGSGPEGFRTKGDGMWHVDAAPVTPEQIVGRVKGLRFGGGDVEITRSIGIMEKVRLWAALIRNLKTKGPRSNL